MSDALYNSYSLEKTSEEISGSMTIWQDNPSSPYDIGDTFRPVPDAPLLNVRKVNISDNVIGEVNGKPFRQWQVVIEGSTGEHTNSDTNIKYTFDISSDETSGSMEVINKGNAPAFSLSVGKNFNVPGIGSVKCTSIKGSDNYDENGLHTWTTTYEGASAGTGEDDDEDNIGTKYSLSVSADEKTASMEVTNKGSSPSINKNVGDTFTVPGLAGYIKCTSVKASNSYNEHGVQSWNVTYEGTTGEDEETSTPENEISFSYELNGTTVRTIDGEFLALRRSTTPITKKSIVIYNDSQNSVVTIGSNYEGGIAISENIIKEEISKNGVKLKSYYKHTIEVES